MTYDRVNWQNEPSENTPLSAENLNKMDSAIKTLSEMVVANPVEADTDELKKIGIEGTIYKIAGGHELVNSSGSTMTQRSKMAFLDTHLTDDSGNNTTKVEVVKEVTTAQFANETERGLYRITDKPDSVINAEQVAYGSGNVKQALDKMDFKAGDSIEFTLDQYTVFTARLGFSRGKAMVTFFLPKNISATTITPTLPSSCNAYANDETRTNCTISSVSVLRGTQNIVTLIFSIAPATAWTNLGDCMAMVSFNGNVKFTFS